MVALWPPIRRIGLDGDSSLCRKTVECCWQGAKSPCALNSNVKTELRSQTRPSVRQERRGEAPRNALDRAAPHQPHGSPHRREAPLRPSRRPWPRWGPRPSPPVFLEVPAHREPAAPQPRLGGRRPRERGGRAGCRTAFCLASFRLITSDASCSSEKFVPTQISLKTCSVAARVPARSGRRIRTVITHALAPSPSPRTSTGICNMNQYWDL